jgi:hypothetical protein
LEKYIKGEKWKRRIWTKEKDKEAPQNFKITPINEKVIFVLSVRI